MTEAQRLKAQWLAPLASALIFGLGGCGPTGLVGQGGPVPAGPQGSSAVRSSPAQSRRGTETYEIAVQ